MQGFDFKVNHVVVVSHGTRRNVVYAKAETFADAEALKSAAKERGYDDAKIMSFEAFCRMQNEPRRN